MPMPDETTLNHDVAKVGASYLRAIVYIQMGVGLLLMGFGYWTGIDRFALMVRGEQTTGQVVQYLERGAATPGAERWFTAVVVFRNDAQTIYFQDWNGREYQGGVPETVSVIYDPRQPSNAIINRPALNWLPWAPVFVLGAFLFLLGVSTWLHRLLFRRTPRHGAA
ncbi:DUF3592 domain-containing protein [Chitinibacter bivalviorum]|uniref:DUF3592 domain-containing protein n=1 Tax=Chitinibacter bivalviorum TaxID=2739434 RepID=A0A7H9BJ03_9NEIS|nr:DUF3592 domain-containing protein [Chitinibacter bivalviorum]QLG88276.1 DUF3592 domain-containing protein [Chitinibacter bivalviorum]